MRSAGAGCRLQTCRRGDPQRFNSAFPATHLSSAKIRDRQGSNLRGQGPLDFKSCPVTTWVRSPHLPASASLAQSVERKALNLVVVGSSPTGGAFFCRRLLACRSPCSLMDKALAP